MPEKWTCVACKKAHKKVYKYVPKSVTRFTIKTKHGPRSAARWTCSGTAKHKMVRLV